MRLGDCGQPRAQTILQDVFLKHKLAGSFLFDGPTGVGKEALAIELGRLLNCERDGGCPPRGLFRTPPVADDGDACSSCKRWRSLQHPDLHLVFPVPTGLWDEAARPGFVLPEDWRTYEFKSIAEVLAAKARDPYFKPEFERPVGIQAEVLRDIVLPAVQRRPVEARMKVVILADAEQMAFGIGNLLLKTLEEPPLDCLLVLTSSVSERLLPTIRSRCQRVGFAPLTPEWIEQRLPLLYPNLADGGKRGGADSKRAAAESNGGGADIRTAAFLAQGSMLAAERYLTGVLGDVRDRAFAILLAAAESDGLELLQLAHATAKGYAGQRHLIPVLLQLLASVARDALLVGEGAAALPAAATRTAGKGAAPMSGNAAALPRLVHEDRIAALQQLAQAFDTAALRHVVRQAQRAERQIAGYVHAELTLGSFFLGLARARTGARPAAARA